MLDGGRSGAGEGFGSEITSSIDQVKKLRVEKRTLIDGLKADQERMRILEAQRANLTKAIPQHLRDEKDLQREIKSLKKKYETQSLSQQDERAILKEIDGLKRALGDM